MFSETIVNRVFALVICLASLTLFACGGGGDPADVAQSYWSAIKTGDTAAAEQWIIANETSTSSTGFGKAQFETDKIDEIRFGQALVEGDSARVPTTVVPTADATKASPTLGEINFDTKLVKIDGVWKVDQQLTENNMLGAVFAMAMGAMGQAFSEGMQGAMEGVGEALAEGMTQGMQALGEGLAEGFEGLGAGLEQIADAGEMVEPSSHTYQAPVVLPARVSGSIRGTGVELTSAEWSNTLSIYAGDGWGSNPSLLLFLFLDKGEVPAAHTINVKSEDGGYGNPHVHYRWRDPQTGKIETEIVTSNYDLELTFGEPIEGRVEGKIAFSIPGEETHVAGDFMIELNN